MSSALIRNSIRFFLLAIMQVLIFKRVAFNWGDFAFIHFLVYPLFIIMLPIKMPRPLVIFLGFLIGIFVDLFYDSPGVHASAGVFTGYARGLILDLLEPYEGYNTNDSPTIETMGISWFMSYSSIILGLHLFYYFSVEAFSFVYIFEIVMNTIFSFIASFIILMLYLLIFRPKR
ncbi:MAG: hypothetical protein P1U56_13920 [Saprospiraceae bacterium]|nr:hypothetical protein [Saprospiraceae bacterium]